MRKLMLTALLALALTAAVGATLPAKSADAAASVPPVAWHAVTYYPDSRVPPTEFDADLTFMVDFGLGGGPGGNHVLEGRHKPGSGSWLPWQQWSGQWTSCDLGECLFEAATDGHYNTLFSWQVRVRNTSTGATSSVYSFTLLYPGA